MRHRLSIVLAMLLGACGDDPATPPTEQPVRDDVVPSGWQGSGLSYEAGIQQVDPTSLDYAADRMACIVPFRNHGNTFAQPSSNYAQQPTAAKQACAASLQELYDYIDGRRAQYEAVSDAPAFARALRSARLIQQWQQTNAVANGTESSRFRDGFMAENAAWLLDQAEPGTRMMLWAHNGHIARRPGAMGEALDGMFGADYVNLGFIFGRGSFNAVGVTNGVFNQLQAWETDYVAPGSIEELFVETGEPRLLLDNRLLVDGGPAAVPLRGPILIRSIGAAYDRSRPQAFFSVGVMPGLYDLLMFVEETAASTLIPFD